jgi:hypothetical protein
MYPRKGGLFTDMKGSSFGGRSVFRLSRKLEDVLWLDLNNKGANRVATFMVGK